MADDYDVSYNEFDTPYDYNPYAQYDTTTDTGASSPQGTDTGGGFIAREMVPDQPAVPTVDVTDRPNMLSSAPATGDKGYSAGLSLSPDQVASQYSDYLDMFPGFQSTKVYGPGESPKQEDTLSDMSKAAKGGDESFGSGVTGVANKLFGTTPGSKGESLVLGALFSGVAGMFGYKDKQAAREANTMVAQSSMLRATTEAKVAEDNERERQRRIAATGKGLIESGPRKTIGYGQNFNPIYKKAT